MCLELCVKSVTEVENWVICVSRFVTVWLPLLLQRTKENITAVTKGLESRLCPSVTREEAMKIIQPWMYLSCNSMTSLLLQRTDCKMSLVLLTEPFVCVTRKIVHSLGDVTAVTKVW